MECSAIGGSKIDTLGTNISKTISLVNKRKDLPLEQRDAIVEALKGGNLDVQIVAGGKGTTNNITQQLQDLYKKSNFPNIKVREPESPPVKIERNNPKKSSEDSNEDS